MEHEHEHEAAVHLEIKEIAGVYWLLLNGERYAGPFPNDAACRAAAKLAGKEIAAALARKMGLDSDAPLPPGTQVTPRQIVPETNLYRQTIEFPESEKR
jgi:hypothetical protein